MNELLNSDIFSGLEKFGLAEVVEKNLEVFESEPIKEEPKKEKEPKLLNIDDFIYEKSYVCPVCNFHFKSCTLRYGKVRIKSIEFDLRPIYTSIEPMFYDIVLCEGCGYATAAEGFDKVSKKEAEKVLSEITPQFRPIPYPKEPTIEMAIDRYKLALLNAVVRQGRDGERAYLCMKLTWLYRLKGEEFLNERKFATLALRGFTSAIRDESPPIMGISESAVMYIIAAFSTFMGDKSGALKILSNLLVSKATSNRLKNRARDLKDTITSMKSKGL